jgi:hypothetical protein
MRPSSPCRALVSLALASWLICLSVRGGEPSAPAAPPIALPAKAPAPGGVLRLVGTPEEIGRRHGTLLRDRIRVMLAEYVGDDLTPEGWPGPAALARVRALRAVLPDWYRQELNACAAAAGVDEDVLLFAQCEGDIKSLGGCTSYVGFGPATHGGQVEIGRNFDYWGLESTATCAIVLAVIPAPADGHAFVAVGWTGILGGWTLFNEKGLFVANNLGGFRGRNPLGLPTLVLTRLIAQKAGTLDEAIAILRASPRMRGQALVIGQAGDPARGSAAAAATIAYDAARVEVTPARDGFAFHSSIGRDPDDVLEQLRRPHRHAYDPIRAAGGSITLHSVAIRPQEGLLWVAHGSRQNAHLGTYVQYDVRSLLAR